MLSLIDKVILSIEGVLGLTPEKIEAIRGKGYWCTLLYMAEGTLITEGITPAEIHAGYIAHTHKISFKAAIARTVREERVSTVDKSNPSLSEKTYCCYI